MLIFKKELRARIEELEREVCLLTEANREMARSLELIFNDLDNMLEIKRAKEEE